MRKLVFALAISVGVFGATLMQHQREQSRTKHEQLAKRERERARERERDRSVARPAEKPPFGLVPSTNQQEELSSIIY